MKKYAATKPSGVEWLGDVPAHWEVKRLKSVVESVINGVWGEEALGDETDLVCVRVADFDYTALGVSSKKLTQRFIAEKERKGRLLSKGDILIERSGGGETQLVGRVIQYTLKAPAVCSNFISKLEVNRERVNRRFFTYMFAALYNGRLNYGHIKQTTGIQNLDLASYLNEVMGFPPLPEQRAIAAFLDARTAHLDGLIRRKEDLLKLLAEQRAALITRAVTRGLDGAAPLRDSGVPWLGQVPAHWEVKRLKFMLDGIEQGWSPQCDNQPAEAGEWGVLKVGCVNGDEFEPMENKRLPVELEPLLKYEVQIGDVLMSRANTKELVGSTAIVRNMPTKLMLCDKLYRLQVPEDKVDKEFLVYMLRSKVARVQYEQGASGTSGSMQNIGQDTVLNLELSFPPLNEQVQIAAAIHKGNKRLDTMTDITHREIARLREYRAALITAAVTGRIDVRAAVAPTPEPAPADAL